MLLASINVIKNTILSYIFIPTFAIPFIFVLSIAGAQAIIETFVGVAVKQTKHLSNENDLVIEPDDSQYVIKRDTYHYIQRILVLF